MRQANLGLDLTTKRTRKREFLDEIRPDPLQRTDLQLRIDVWITLH